MIKCSSGHKVTIDNVLNERKDTKDKEGRLFWGECPNCRTSLPYIKTGGCIERSKKDLKRVYEY